MKNTALHILLVLSLALLALSVSAQNENFRVLRTIELGGESGWDYLTFDKESNRLFIARSTRVMVVDTTTGKSVGTISGTAGVHGIALVRELGKGFTSNGRTNTVTIFDMKSLKPTGEINVGAKPDAIIYDSASGRVFTFNAISKDATAIDAESGKVAGTLPLGGKPEFAVPDGQGGMYVNIEDRSQVIHFDAKKLAVLHTWPISGCKDPTGLALDAAHQRLFIGCSNEKLVVMDAQSGRVVASLPIGSEVDGVAFDPELQLVFASAGSGTLSIYHEDSPETFKLLQNVPTLPGARTLTLDPSTHIVYTVSEIPPKPFTLVVVGK